MTAIVRHCSPALVCKTILFYVFSLSFIPFCIAFPVNLTAPLLPRNNPIINNATGTIQVFDPHTDEPIPQYPATDGGGSGFDLPAIIWIVFCGIIGLPMATAGIRGWKITNGVAIGLSLAVCSWAGLINTVSGTGISDTLLTVIVMAFFFVGFVLGIWKFAHIVAIALLGLNGGLAFGTRILLLKSDDLLFSAENHLGFDWSIPVVFAGITAISMILYQRKAILAACSSIGTFLLVVGFDLLKSRQSGMSRGLRLLFDRNDNHIADILSNGYHPELITRIAIAVSLALVEVLILTLDETYQ